MPTPTSTLNCLVCDRDDNAECFVCREKLRDGRQLVTAKVHTTDNVRHLVHSACADAAH